MKRALRPWSRSRRAAGIQSRVRGTHSRIHTHPPPYAARGHTANARHLRGPLRHKANAASGSRHTACTEAAAGGGTHHPLEGRQQGPFWSASARGSHSPKDGAPGAGKSGPQRPSCLNLGLGFGCASTPAACPLMWPVITFAISCLRCLSTWGCRAPQVSNGCQRATQAGVRVRASDTCPATRGTAGPARRAEHTPAPARTSASTAECAPCCQPGQARRAMFTHLSVVDAHGGVAPVVPAVHGRLPVFKRAVACSAKRQNEKQSSRKQTAVFKCRSSKQVTQEGDARVCTRKCVCVCVRARACVQRCVRGSGATPLAPRLPARVPAPPAVRPAARPFLVLVAVRVALPKLGAPGRGEVGAAPPIRAETRPACTKGVGGGGLVLACGLRVGWRWRPEASLPRGVNRGARARGRGREGAPCVCGRPAGRAGGGQGRRAERQKGADLEEMPRASCTICSRWS